MGSARKEVKGFNGFNLVVFEQEFYVAGLSGGVAGEINNCFGFNFV